MLKVLAIPLHRAGYPFVAAFAAATAGLFLLSPALGWAGIVLTLWCYWFFRDPARVTPARAGLVVSPADGVVSSVGAVAPPPELELGAGPLDRVSIFMNVFNCHVNRCPADGRVATVAYRPGRFVNASLDKASEDNERNGLALDTPCGRRIGVVQIAGLVARRIVCHAAQGDDLRAGERFGIIRFGSRLDVYLPAGVAPLVAVGQTMVAGETVLADLAGAEPPRPGEVR